jgi:hypothetical protein
MDRATAYEFVRLYSRFMLSASDHVQIVDVDPAVERIELKVAVPGKPTVQRWHDFWHAAKVIEANSGRE